MSKSKDRPPWSRKRRAKFMATIKRNRAAREKNGKPIVVTRTGEMIINASRRGERVVLLRIELV
jgi:hypothetical protein